MSEPPYIQMGVSSRPHGVKGAVVFNLFNETDSSLRPNIPILLKPQGKSKLKQEGEEWIIESIAFGNKVIVYLEGLSSLTSAAEMLPFEIWMKREHFVPLDNDDEIFCVDLVGLTVIDFTSKKEVGAIESFYWNSAQVIFIIKKFDGSEIDIPFVDLFFKDINLKEKRVEVTFPIGI